MRPIRVYADTSIFGGYFDDDFSDASRRFFNQVRSGRFLLVTSPLVAQELALAPQMVLDLFTSLLSRMQVVPVTSEAEDLQQAYVDAGIVPPSAKMDALHVALATVSGCSMIVSWNFRHIVHFQRMAQYNLVNLSRGYPQIGIFSPAEVIEDENEDL
jgi:predicted nucleic acid-binding protein